MGLYRRPDSPTWWMSLQVAGKRTRMPTGVIDRDLAEEIHAAWRTELARTRWLGAPPPEQDHTVQELIDEYLASVTPRKAPESQRRDRGVLARLSAEWGALTLGELNAKMVEDYLADRLEDVCFATASKELGILKSAYRHAIRWGWASSSPFTGIPLNQEGDQRIRWLTDEEEGRLVGACAPWLQKLVLVGLDTGLRRGNLVGLEWDWVQQQGTVLVIPRRAGKGKKTSVVIPLTTRAAAILRRQVRRPHTTRVYTQPDGTPYSLDQVGTAVIRAARAAGLMDVSLHTLRHTFVSRLVQAGRPLPEVAELAGHRDIRMTMRYAHLAPSHLREGILALDRRQHRHRKRATKPPSR